jgi:hypothetical protein
MTGSVYGIRGVYRYVKRKKEQVGREEKIKPLAFYLLLFI